MRNLCLCLAKVMQVRQAITMDTIRRTYLDYAAGAPVNPKARAAFLAAIDTYGNPSSPHEEGRASAQLLHDARSRIAALAGIKQRHVVFTSGATEANALAIRGFVEKLLSAPATEDGARNMPMRTHVLYLPSAHASTVHTVMRLADDGIRVEPIPLKEGRIDLEALGACITPETSLLVVDAICGETGTRFDLRGVRKTLEAAEQRLGIPPICMHVDASQLPYVESFDRLRLAADTLTLDAQKVGGIRGIGALVVGDLNRLAPIMDGGGQEEGLRPGTEPVALAAAFAAALQDAVDEQKEFVARAQRARSSLFHSVQHAPIPGIPYETKHQAPHIVNMSYPGIDTDFLVTVLDAKGFAVSTRSACETENEGSRAVLVLTGDETRARSTLRVSWGPQTTESELESFASVLNEAVATLDAQNKSFDAPTRA